MITGDQLAIAKETGRRLGMGTNMYPSSSLLGNTKDEALATLPVEELIEKADGFAGVFPGKSSSSSIHISFGDYKCNPISYFSTDLALNYRTQI